MQHATKCHMPYAYCTTIITSGNSPSWARPMSWTIVLKFLLRQENMQYAATNYSDTSTLQYAHQNIPPHWLFFWNKWHFLYNWRALQHACTNVAKAKICTIRHNKLQQDKRALICPPKYTTTLALSRTTRVRKYCKSKKLRSKLQQSATTQACCNMFIKTYRNTGTCVHTTCAQILQKQKTAQ